MSGTKFNAPAPWLPRQISTSSLGGYGEGPSSLRARPIAAQKIAECISAWSFAEHELVQCLGYLISSEGWVASEIYNNIRKLRPRIELMKRIVRDKLGKEFAEAAQDIFKEILEFSPYRDQLAHGKFIVPQNYATAIVRVDGLGADQKYYLYDLSILEALSSEFIRRSDRVVDLRYVLMHLWNTARYEKHQLVFPRPDPVQYDLLKRLPVPPHTRQHHPSPEGLSSAIDTLKSDEKET